MDLSAMKPVLTTSASPVKSSFSGRVPRVSRSTSTPAGAVEGPDEVLAFGRVDAGLAADCGVDHAEHGGGDVDDADAAQPGGGDEAAEIAHGSPADGDDGIGASEVGLTEHLPAEGRDLNVLGFFGIRDLRCDGLETGGGEVVADDSHRWCAGHAGG